MRYLLGLAAAGLMLATANCAGTSRLSLKPTELAECQASGGYASVSPFGFPICQADYADAGEPCKGKSDCAGRCLSEAPDNAGTIPVGSVVVGRCEPHRSTFGCNGRVEDGKLAEPYICDD